MAIAAVAAVALLRYLTSPLVGAEASLAALIVSVVVAAWFGGFGPGLFATALSAFLGDYFLLEPRSQFGLDSASDVIRLVLFGAEGVFVSWLISTMKAANEKATAAAVLLKRQKSELAASEEQFRAFFETAAVGLAQTDPATRRFVRVNRALAEITGYSESELRSMSFVDLTHPEDREADERTFQRFASGETPVYLSEKRYVRRDGRVIWVQVSARITRCAHAQGDRTVAIIQDVTAKRAAESELLAAKDAAEAANEAKSRFLANMSHEIRTPLGVILGFADFLEDPNLPKADRVNTVGVIKRNGRQLMRIIEEVLDLAKVEANRFEVEKEDVDLAEVIEDVKVLTGLRAGEKGLRLTFVGEGPLPGKVHTDPIRLKQILVNVIGNAIKFTERGSVQVIFRVLPGRRVGAATQLEILVKDTGIGIAKDQRDGLFEPFVQIDNTLTRRFGGTGLGLAIARRLARALGGDLVIVESELKVGTTFKLTVDAGPARTQLLATSEAQADTVVAAKTGPTVDLREMRVLVVEDAPDNRVLISRLLRSQGASVEIASDGAECLDILRNKDFDVVLMDIQMPILDGKEATTILRKRGFTKPIVALSAHAMKSEREETMKRGFDDYLTKPIEPDALYQALARYHPSRKGDALPLPRVPNGGSDSTLH